MQDGGHLAVVITEEVVIEGGVEGAPTFVRGVAVEVVGITDQLNGITENFGARSQFAGGVRKRLLDAFAL
ncbi:MAG: hypothetical protein ACJ74U_18695 [Jatrophihabitantaceae bacterium]